MKKNKSAAAFLGVFLMAIGVPPAALAADPPADVQPSQSPALSLAPAPARVDVEVFQGVRIRSGPGSNLYPKAEASSGREGWVVLNMMIDPEGKPYEAMVVDSSGKRDGCAVEVVGDPGTAFEFVQ